MTTATTTYNLTHTWTKVAAAAPATLPEGHVLSPGESYSATAAGENIWARSRSFETHIPSATLIVTKG